jgi:translocation and assembly module TamB
MRRLLKWLAVLAAFLVALSIALYLLVQTPYFQAQIKDRVIAAVETGLNARLRIERVSGNPLYGLSLYGVRLSLPDGSEVLAARRVRVSYFLPRLIWSRGDYSVSLRVEDFLLNAVRERDGRFNLQRLLKGPAGPQRRIRLRAVSLSGGRVRLAFEGGGHPTYAVERLQANGSLSVLTGPHPDFEARLDRASLALAAPVGLEVRRLSGTGRAGGGVLLAELLAETAGSSVRLAFDTRDGGRTFSLQAGASPVALAEVARFTPAVPPRGDMRGSLSLQGPRGAARLAAVFRLPEGTLKAAGTLDLREPSRPGYGLAVTLGNVNPAAVSVAASRAGLGGSLSGEVRLAGRGLSSATMFVDFEAKLLPSRLGKYEIKTAGLTGGLAQGALQVREAHAEFPFGRVAASGEVSDVASLSVGKLAARLSGRVERFDAGRLLARPGLASSIDASFQAAVSRPSAGKPLAASVRVDLLDGAVIAGRTIRAGTLAASLTGDRLEVSRLRLVSPLVELSGSGSATLTPPDNPRLEATFEARAADAGPLAQALRPGTDVSGGLSLRGHVAGTLKAPAIDAEAEARSLRYRAYSVKSLSASLSAWNLREPVPQASFSVRAQGVSEGAKPLLERAAAEGRLRGGKLEFNLAAAADSQRLLRLAGTGRDITRTSADLTLDTVRLSLPGLKVENTKPLRIEASQAGVRVTDVALASADGSLRLTGGLGSAEPLAERLAMTLELAGLKLSPWLPKGTPVSGIATGVVRASGTLSEPRLTGRVSLAGAAFEGAGGKKVSLERAQAQFDYGAGRLRVDALVAHKGDQVSAAGSVPVTLSAWPPRAVLETSGLNVAVRTKGFDLSFLAAVTGAKAEVSGTLSATLSLTGNPREPDVEGRAEVAGGAFSGAGLPQGLHNAAGQFAFNRDRLVIERLTADSDGGRMEARGEVGLRGAMVLNVAVEARSFRVPIRRDSWGRVNADLNVIGTRLEPTVKGQVRVEEARINIPERLIPSLREIRIVDTPEELRRPARQPEGALVSLQRSVAVDVTLTADNRVFVKGRGLDAEFAINMQAVKDRQGPLRLAGTAQAVRGTFNIKGKRLVIERAEALFRGLPEPNPEISARLSYDVKDITVVITVTGSMDSPQVNITSEPPTDQTNVYSYLFFGRPADQLKGGEGSVLQQQVAGLVGSGAAQELAGVLGQQLAIDTLDVTPAEGELGIQAVSLGKYLTKDLFVTFQRSFGIEAENQVRINYRLSKRFSVESQFGSERTTGVDIFWNYDFSHFFGGRK